MQLPGCWVALLRFQVSLSLLLLNTQHPRPKISKNTHPTEFWGNRWRQCRVGGGAVAVTAGRTRLPPTELSYAYEHLGVSRGILLLIYPPRHVRYTQGK
jgi:hypothetical protein